MRLRRRVVWILALSLSWACSRKPVSIDVSPKRVKIYGLERSQRLTAHLLDKKGQALETGTPTWSSSKTDIVTVDSSGRMVAKAEGKAMVSAKYESITVQVPVEVVDVKGIEVLPASVRLIGPIGTPVSLQAIVKNSKDKPVDIKPTWTSANPKIASVSAEGGVSSVAPGTTTIIAKLGDLEAASEITVVVRDITRLEIHPVTALVRVGDSQRFEIVAYGPDGKPIEGVAAAFRSSDPAVAKVDAAGTASGIAPGTTTIRAMLAGATAEATLLVN